MKITSVKIIISFLLVIIVGLSFWIFSLKSKKDLYTKPALSVNDDSYPNLDSVHLHFEPYIAYARAMELLYAGNIEESISLLDTLIASANQDLQKLAKTTQLHQIKQTNVDTVSTIKITAPQIKYDNEDVAIVLLNKPDLQENEEKEDTAQAASRPLLHLVSQQGKKFEYIGESTNQQASGYGIAVYETGSIYKGHWKNNKKHGQGIFIWKDGERYEGRYVDDKRDGMGTYTWINGEYYIGEWKSDQRNGKGVLYRKNGKIKKEGVWEKDEFIKREKIDIITST